MIISSGDSVDSVAAAATVLGVSSWHARQTPADKLELVSRLRTEGHTIVMVGDGANDAPVLAQADAAIAIGSGTALARASADAIIVGEALSPLLDLVMIAERSAWTIRLSLIWAATYNAIGVSVATLGWISPWMAAIGMTASSLLVVWNALRLKSVVDAHDSTAVPEQGFTPVPQPKAVS